jgi:hypothetical protein
VISEGEQHILSLETLVGALEVDLGEGESVTEMQHAVH